MTLLRPSKRRDLHHVSRLPPEPHQPRLTLLPRGNQEKRDETAQRGTRPGIVIPREPCDSSIYLLCRMSSPGSGDANPGRASAKVQETSNLLPSPFPDEASSTSNKHGLGLSYSPSSSYPSRREVDSAAEGINPDLDDGDDVEDVLESSAEEDDQQHEIERPDFHPFFTIVQDSGASGSSHHHPHVHYIFSDDDPEPVTSALLRSLDRTGSTADGQQNLRERAIIVDLAADGQTVVSTKSLSPNWQTTKTSMQSAPTFDGADVPKEAALMLSITGTERAPTPPEDFDEAHLLRQAESVAQGNLFAAMESLAEQSGGRGSGDGALQQARRKPAEEVERADAVDVEGGEQDVGREGGVRLARGDVGGSGERDVEVEAAHAGAVEDEVGRGLRVAGEDGREGRGLRQVAGQRGDVGVGVRAGELLGAPRLVQGGDGGVWFAGVVVYESGADA
ncbi:hypothetical protein FH972_021506 [Carpinus fangiana]|uniref:Uncharacterized protein n=1 Tax=Carpinus fangiana TaxID=176857 RepID=A0A5N6KPW5_9ROSI|nr:hypothetical protein FH972_021506 [Carpinus fangiana]